MHSALVEIPEAEMPASGRGFLNRRVKNVSGLFAGKYIKHGVFVGLEISRLQKYLDTCLISIIEGFQCRTKNIDLT